MTDFITFNGDQLDGPKHKPVDGSAVIEDYLKFVEQYNRALGDYEWSEHE